MKKTILIFILLLVGIGCSENNIEDEYPKEITFVTIGKGSLYGNGIENIERSSLIISNQTDWQSIVTQMDSYNTVSDNFIETGINFNTYTIVAVFGEVNPSASELEITGIIENQEGIAISYSINTFANTVVTQPYHLVKIPITEKSLQ